MEYIHIPTPDFSFDEIIKKKALFTADIFIRPASFQNQWSANKLITDLNSAITRDFKTLNSLQDKLLYISEFLICLNPSYDKIIRSIDKEDSQIINPLTAKIIVKDKIDEVKHLLYNRLSLLGYNLDKNAFTDIEVKDLERKINAILIKLDEIQVGNEVLFNEVNDLKSDIQSLKTDMPLGKKRWYQRATGIVATFAVNKGAGVIFDETLKPMIANLIHNSPAIEKLLH